MRLFSRTIPVSADARKISELLTRGVERIFPSADFAEKRLKSGARLTVYLGIDPTGPTLHLGHLIPLLKLAQFQTLGHKIILLIGDFTATIGDPTDKVAARKRITREEALRNARGYKKQASRILSFRSPNAAELRYNSEWLEKLSYANFHDLASLVTVDQFIKRDMFEARQRAGKPIYLHEFVYPLLQGYDSVALETDMEIGGNDQTFNMLVGRDLISAIQKREKTVIGMKLLTDPTGKKMGKTEGNMVTLTDEPADMYGKVMSWPDTMIVSGFELCTTVPLTDIEQMKKELETGVNPRELKAKLAEEIVSLLHGEEQARKARAAFDAAFVKMEPAEFIEVARDCDPMTVLIEKGIISSRTELRRLIAAGAVTRLDSGAKVGEDFISFFPVGKYRIGKRRFVRIY